MQQDFSQDKVFKCAGKKKRYACLSPRLLVGKHSQALKCKHEVLTYMSSHASVPTMTLGHPMKARFVQYSNVPGIQTIRRTSKLGETPEVLGRFRTLPHMRSLGTHTSNPLTTRREIKSTAATVKVERSAQAYLAGSIPSLKSRHPVTPLCLQPGPQEEDQKPLHGTGQWIEFEIMRDGEGQHYAGNMFSGTTLIDFTILQEVSCTKAAQIIRPTAVQVQARLPEIRSHWVRCRASSHGLRQSTRLPYLSSRRRGGMYML